MRERFFQKENLISAVIIISALLGGFSIVFAQSRVVSRWNGTSVSEKTAQDTSGGNNGSMQGGVVIASGKTGNAFKFDGASGYITMGNPKNLNFGTGAFSIEAFFNWDGNGSSANNIIRKSNYPVRGPGAGYWLKIGRDNRTIEFSVGATTGPEGQSLVVAPISPGAWHRVVATRYGSDAVRIYIDGQSKGKVVRQSPKAQSTSEAPFTLGAWNDRFGPTEFFSGLIEEVSVSAYPEIQYPVQELGNCKNETECRASCNQPEFSRSCLEFVKKHGLAAPDEIEKWEEFIDVASGGGPGGCKDEKECIAYCEDASRIVECTDFVAKHNLVSPEELAEMQKIAKAVKGGAKLPGNCHNKAECISYCEDESHNEECVEFGEKAGFISKEDAEFIRKSGGKSPGDCAKGLKSSEEGKKACSAFCAKSENQQVCMDFAVKIGLISADDAKELGGGGSLEDFNACLPYINKEALACFDVLGKDLFEQLKAGNVPQDIDTVKDMVKKMKTVRTCLNKNTDEQFSKLPPGGLTCLEKEFGENPIEKIKSGKLSCRQFAGTEERVKTCFMETMQKQIDECLSLSCSEVASCFKKLETGDHKDRGGSSQLDPGFEKKLKDRLNSCIGEQINECLTKDCSEVQACINKLQQGGGGEEQKGESQQDPAIEAKIKEKITSCFKGQKGGGFTGGAPLLDIGECSKQGGTWNGQQCDFSKKGGGGGFSPGGGFSGGGPLLDSGECTKQGGTWDGQKCDFSKKGAGGGVPSSGGQGPQGRVCPVLVPRACPAGQKAQQYKDAQGCDAQTECFPESTSGSATFPSGGSSFVIPTTPELCASFSSTPSCSYLGSPDSQNYKLCKQCFPNK